MLDPLPLQSKPSRYWINKKTSSLLLPGLRTVEVSFGLPSEHMIDRLSISSRTSGWGMFPLLLHYHVFNPKPPLSSDQFCSLSFSLSGLYLVGCVYKDGFNLGLERCGPGPGAPTHAWMVPFALSALPLFIRLVQSVRRYMDSKLITHLINVSNPHFAIPEPCIPRFVGG